MRPLLDELLKMMNGPPVSWEGNETRTEQVHEIVQQKNLYRTNCTTTQVVGGGDERLYELNFLQSF